MRVKKTEDAGGTWKTTYTLFDGDNPLLQEIYGAAGRIQTTYNVIVEGKILAQYKTVYPSTLSVVYFYLDNLGSRRVLVNSGGSAIGRYRYSAWGKATQDVGTDDLRSYTGKDYDASGLIYFNARYYDPLTGRFLSEDPSRKVFNYYSYVQSNPVARVDPNGRDDIYCDPMGNYLQTVTAETTNVYVRTTDPTGGGRPVVSNTLVGSQAGFNTYTAAVYGETSGNAEESRGIADVIMNRAQVSGRTTTDIIQNTGIYGYNEASRSATAQGSTAKRQRETDNFTSGRHRRSDGQYRHLTGSILLGGHQFALESGQLLRESNGPESTGVRDDHSPGRDDLHAIQP